MDPNEPYDLRSFNPKIFKDNTDGTIDQWVAAMKNKIYGDADHYPTDHQKKHYVLTRIGGQAFDFLESRIDPAAADASTTAEEILDAPYNIYGDHNRPHDDIIS